MNVLLHFFLPLVTTLFLISHPALPSEIRTENFQSVDDLDDSEFDIPSANSSTIYDPLEKFNRGVHEFNDRFDRYFFKHVATAYRKSLPEIMRKSIRNFITNLYLPISATNSILQGKVDNSLATFSHFLINTTLGIGGLFDVASKKQIRYTREDFGQTLGLYKASSGIYLVLPFLGPSSARDLSGMLVDKSVNPLDFGFVEFSGKKEMINVNFRIALSGVNAVDKRESLLDIVDDIRHDSFDPYATIRSAYLQKRQNDINN